MLNKSEHLYLVSDLRGNAFRLSLLSMMLSVGLSFIMLRKVSSMPTFWRVFFFIINGYWILSKAFSTSIEIIIWILFFNLLINHTDWFVDIEKSLHPWDKSHFIMMLDPFKVLLGLDCQYFAERVCICVHQWYGL